MMRPRYLGIDIGGTKIRGVLWDGRRVIASSEVPTPGGLGDFRREVAALAARLCRRTRGGIRGIGIGAAGVIRGTRIESSRNIPYLKAFDFRTLFPGAALRVDNDARAFGRAEWMRGAGRGATRILVFTVGTGIGRAYGAAGKMRRWRKFEYPEGWERRYQRIRDSGARSALAVFLGRKLSTVIKRYPADIIVIGGGVFARPGFSGRLSSALKRHGVRQPVRLSRRGKNAVAIGAALLFSTLPLGK